MAIVVTGNLRFNLYLPLIRIGELMTDEKNSESKGREPVDPKEKFREALEKKKKSGGIRNNNTTGGPNVSGGQAQGKTQKMFRRKSGSA